jgi:MHS family proline/betaine transporter-like MFS transporter
VPATTLTQSPPIAGWPDGSAHRWRVIFAVSIGNALEWFDYVIFGYLAAIIARLFFPASDPAASLLLTLASFGVTFFMRPLGAVVLGRLADRRGRKAALQVSILMMMAGSLLIAVAPVYQTIGFLAPVLMVLARLVQGFSVGGEFGSATAIFAEQDPKHRGYYASWQFASQGLAAMLATGFGAAVTFWLSPEQIDAWGWRVPFLFGAMIGPIGFYIRRRVNETVEFQALRDKRQPPPLLFAGSRLSLLTAFGLVILGTVAVYTLLFIPTFAVRHLGLPISNSFAAVFFTGVLHLVFIPIFGMLSDRIGRTPGPIFAGLVMLIAIYPALAWLANGPTVFKLFMLQGVYGIVSSAYLGAVPSLMAELFPTNIRGSGLSISYAFAVAIFGGFAPFIHEWLISTTGSPLALSYYMMFAAIVGLLALAGARSLGHR